ncbi:unnamed protein product [Anisakis simplex]|uniref:Transmembrane protein 245 (inferred by orthology to a human protein) n=1 Tax=Anisakis simplex TaxID=6269 RepID=A0A0M3K9W7_ANISI|nr:unnamed protein product [Anisakis simplex]
MSSPRTDLASQLTSTSDQKIAFQFAFYNALVFVLTSICLAGVYAVYRIFYMFLTPIMWAVLVGTILFPLKRRITSAIGGWLTKLDNEDTPLVIGLIRLPFDTVNSLSDLLLDYATRECNYGFYVKILPLIILYFAAYAGWIYVQDKDTINKKLARVLSLPIWIYALAFVANFFGPLRSVVFAGASAALGLIAAGIISADEETESQESSGIQQKEAVTAQLKSDEANPSDTAGRIDKALTGDFYIQAIFGLCVLLFATHHDIVIILVTVLLAYALIGNLG